MSVDYTMLDAWHKAQADNGPAKDLQSGGGGGTFDGMEARVAKLENSVEQIKGQLTDIRVTLASIDERTKQMATQLATKWDVVLILGAMAALVGGVVALTARFLP